MGQIYKGTLVIQTQNYASPTGDYTLLPLGNQAESADVKNDKQGYDSNGDVVTGAYDGGYAGIISSYEEMDSYLTEENVGRILKYVGKEEIPGGGQVPIEIGDILESTQPGSDSGHPIMYINSAITPNFAEFDQEKLSSEDGYALMSVDENGASMPFMIAYKASVDKEDGASGVVYVIHINETVLYAESPTLSPSIAELTSWGWQKSTGPVEIEKWGGDAVVTALAQQDVWGKYISKEPFSGGSEPKYKTNQTYIIENQDGEIKALPISE